MRACVSAFHSAFAESPPLYLLFESNHIVTLNVQPGERSRGPCMICARSSNGHHYSVQSCEGCKGFFRRSVLHKFKYECKTGNNDCDLINTSDRQRCQLCRLRTCFEHGMREAFVKKTLRKSRKSKAMVSWRRSVIVEPFTFEQRLLVNESLTIWLNAINPDARRRITNEVLPNSSAIGKGLAMFTVMTNAKAKLIAQNFSMMSHLHDFTASEQKIMLNKTMNRAHVSIRSWKLTPYLMNHYFAMTFASSLTNY